MFITKHVSLHLVFLKILLPILTIEILLKYNFQVKEARHFDALKPQPQTFPPFQCQMFTLHSCVVILNKFLDNIIYSKLENRRDKVNISFQMELSSHAPQLNC